MAVGHQNLLRSRKSRCATRLTSSWSLHDEDPEMRPEPISLKKREEVLAHMAAGLMAAYRYFRQRRDATTGTRMPESRSTASNVGRNDACPCGSGKKYKRCCGSATIN